MIFSVFILIMFVTFLIGGSLGFKLYEQKVKKQIDTANIIEIDNQFYVVFKIKCRDFTQKKDENNGDKQ